MYAYVYHATAVIYYNDTLSLTHSPLPPLFFFFFGFDGFFACTTSRFAFRSCFFLFLADIGALDAAAAEVADFTYRLRLFAVLLAFTTAAASRALLSLFSAVFPTSSAVRLRLRISASVGLGLAAASRFAVPMCTAMRARDALVSVSWAWAR